MRSFATEVKGLTANSQRRKRKNQQSPSGGANAIALRWYGERDVAPWDLGYHLGLWRRAHAAFRNPSFQDFELLYNELRSKWQVFRGSHESHWTAEQIYAALGRCAPLYTSRRLSELTNDDAIGLWSVVREIEGVKKLADGPAVVAISKFLHFWNPRLFVIVDHAMMWEWVFGHHWLWESVLETRDGLWSRVGLTKDVPIGTNCDLLSYLAIVLWGGSVIRDNPTILKGFNEYAAADPAAGNFADVAHFEAVALEWFLLGCVELPPNGITQQ